MREGTLSDSESATLSPTHPPAREMKSDQQVHCATRHWAHSVSVSLSLSLSLSESCLYFYMFKCLHLLFTLEPLDGGAASLVGAAGLLLPTNCFSRIWFIVSYKVCAPTRRARVWELIVRLQLRGLSVYGRRDFGQLWILWKNYKDLEDVNQISMYIIF